MTQREKIGLTHLIINPNNMKVDFNSIRKMLISEYSDLCFLLNNSIQPNDKVVLSINDVKSHMDSLRLLIGIIASTSLEGRDEFGPVGEKELPVFNTEKLK